MRLQAITVFLALGGLYSTSFSSQAISESEKSRVRNIRAQYARVFIAPDGPAILRSLVKAREHSVAGELVGLLAVFGLPLESMGLIHDLIELRPVEKDSLRTRTLLNSVDSQMLPAYSELVKHYPDDFMAHFRFADLSLVKGNRSPDVERSVARVEYLTDNHPIALWLRGAKLYMTPDNEPSLLQKLGEARVYFKLFKSAIIKINPNPRVSRSIKAIEVYLKKKGVTPPEPTAEQYAAVKKRGWAFNKQMLEPFKKVE